MFGKIVAMILTLTAAVSIIGCGEEEIIGTPRIAVTEYYSYCDVPDSSVFIANDSKAYLLDKATGEVSVCCDEATAVSAYGDELLIYQLSQDRIIRADGSVWYDLNELDTKQFPLRGFEVGYDGGAELYTTNVFGTNALYSIEAGDVVYEGSFDVPLFDGNKLNGWIIITEQDDGNVIHELEYQNKTYSLFTLAGGIGSVNYNNYLLNPTAGIFACDAGNEVFLLWLDDETKLQMPDGTALFALYDDCVLYIVPGTNGAPAMLYAADFDGNVQMQMKYDGSRIIIPDTYEKKLYLVDLDSLTAESVEF